VEQQVLAVKETLEVKIVAVEVQVVAEQVHQVKILLQILQMKFLIDLQQAVMEQTLNRLGYLLLVRE
jgi:hypothetical protein